MPIYDFQCQDCQHTFEALVKKSSDDVPCIICAGSNVIKLISRGTSFVLAGGGWYKDGYASSKKDSK
jgi:putative FmdB family regulatory protein